MKYWEDMQSKYGFSDGGSIPVGILDYRKAYILAVNAIAEKLGSGVRAAAYDRPGMHNWCLILEVDVNTTKDWPAEKFFDGSASSEEFPDGDMPRDSAYSTAVEVANLDLDIDSYLIVTTVLHEDKLLADVQGLEVTVEDDPTQ